MVLLSIPFKKIGEERDCYFHELCIQHLIGVRLFFYMQPFALLLDLIKSRSAIF